MRASGSRPDARNRLGEPCHGHSGLLRRLVFRAAAAGLRRADQPLRRPSVLHLLRPDARRGLLVEKIPVPCCPASRKLGNGVFTVTCNTPSTTTKTKDWSRTSRRWRSGSTPSAGWRSTWAGGWSSGASIRCCSPTASGTEELLRRAERIGDSLRGAAEKTRVQASRTSASTAMSPGTSTAAASAGGSSPTGRCCKPPRDWPP